MRKFKFRFLPILMLMIIIAVNVGFSGVFGATKTPISSNNPNIEDIETSQQLGVVVDSAFANSVASIDEAVVKNDQNGDVSKDNKNSASKNNDNKTLPIEVSAKSVILMEPTTGKIILEKKSHDELAPASVTKVMTILLIYEAVENGKISWDDEVSVSAHAASMGGSQIFLEQGEKQTVRDLTKSVVIASANDAAVAMSEYIAGSEDAFVTLMNKRAKELGMNNTDFKNACGLDTDGHYSSAYDIALMTQELMTKHPQVFDYTKTWMDTIVHHTSKGDSDFGLVNTNRLINTYKGSTGLKTGSTSKALYCISATAQRNGMDLIAVVMGAPDPNTRFLQATQMFDYGFSNFMILTGQKEGTKVGDISVLNGEKESTTVVVKNEVKALVAKSNDTSIDYKIEQLEALNAPVAAGTKAGEIIYYTGETEVARCDIVTYEAVEKASFGTNVKKVMKNWFK